MKAEYIQYAIEESRFKNVIHVHTDHGWRLIRVEFATAADVRRLCRVGRSSAYRIMRQLPRYQVVDKRPRKALHQVTVVKRSDLAALERMSAGNPGFRHADYQRALARRPRPARRKNPLDS